MTDRALTVYTALRIHTMEPGCPSGTEVTVDDGGRVELPADELHEVPLWGSVFQGTPHPAGS